MSNKELDYLLQLDVRKSFIPGLGKSQWQPVYADWDNLSQRWGVFSALLENADIADALQKDSWDLMIGDGLPGFGQQLRQWGTRDDVPPIRRV